MSRNSQKNISWFLNKKFQELNVTKIEKPKCRKIVNSWKEKKLPNNALNPFHTTGLFQYPLKTSENLWFSDVFRWYQKKSVAWNGLIKPFWYMAKKSRQKLKYLENGKNFWGEIKSIFIILKDFQLPKIVTDLRVCL